ncbi:MAG: polysaccharide pyruvyl transferase family protein [Candidatus Rifleibacteriota bacterium]
MKILLCGFFGEGNLGDEAILRAVYANIPAQAKLAVTCGRHLSMSGPAIITRKGLKAWPEYLQQAKESDLAVFSGGILQDWTFEGITFFALRILAASIFKAKPALIGTGLGPMRRLAARKISKKALSRVKYAWLRDKPSQELFAKLSKTQANLGTDWTWYFKPETSPMAFANGPIGINLRNWPYCRWQNRINAKLKHIDRKIIGIAARKSDFSMIKKLCPSSTLIKPETINELNLVCQNLSFGIAMRYHVALTMLRCGLPVALIDYDNKVANLADEAGVKLLKQGIVGDFKTAGPSFLSDNQSRFARMQSAFEEICRI